MSSGPGRQLPPSSSYADDDGSADPAIVAVLERYASRTATVKDVVDVLSRTRVLVPVLAHLEGAADSAGDPTSGDGCHDEDSRSASTGITALAGPDGRRVMPVFTSIAAMTAWHPGARPVPAAAPRAALSAVSEDWPLLVLDPAGPVTVLIPRPAVWAMAQGRTWVPAVREGQVDADVHGAIVDAVGDLDHVGSASTEPGRRAEIAVVLKIDPGLDRRGLDTVLAEVNAALAASDVVSERVDSLELRIGRA